MDVYTVTQEFSAPQLGIHLNVLDTVGKIAARTSVLVGAVEYTCKAFYDWVGTADSLNYLSFTGVLPDPVGPGGTTVKSGVVPITSGASVVTVAGAAFGFVPGSVVVSVLKPAAGSNLFATIRAASITNDGFIVDLSSPAPGAGYELSYAAVP